MFVFGVSRVIHYLDDFFVCAKSFDECKESMAVIQSAFDELGVPLAPEKIIGPSSSLTYLGIEIDSVAQVIRLPDEKLNNLKEVLEAWLSRDSCSKRQLLSLIGSLSFAAKVVKPGRMFLRRLINLSTKVSQLHQVVHLDSEAKADIQWWAEFLSSWNGVEYFQAITVTSHSLKLFTDASSHGFGAVYGSHWFSSPWSSQFIHQHINFLELFAIVSAVLTWGHEWFNQQIIIYTDNYCIVNVWRSGSCKNTDIMKLVRKLFLFAARGNINILMQHIPGVSNASADALSRLQLSRFRQLVPHADPDPTPISIEAWRI